MRKVKKRKCGKYGESNHKDKRCSSVRLWGDRWKLKRGWHKGEERAIQRGVLVERCEKGWVKQDQVVTIVKCIDCGISST